MLGKYKKTNFTLLFLDLVLIVVLVLTYGFERFAVYKPYMILALPILLVLLLAVNGYHYLKSKNNLLKRQVIRVDLWVLGIVLLAEITTLIVNFETTFLKAYIDSRFVLEYGLFLYFFLQLTFFVRKIYSLYFNPALLFVSSFALVALTGTFLLMLPVATTQGIGFVDALFTATSAVAVTGLVVVDTATAFTSFGHTVILILIQIGGLGMLTFTSFFAYFFRTGATFSESLYMKDIIGNEKLGNVMRLTMEIVVFAIVIELIGALFIYSSLNQAVLQNNRLFFSIFHSISAFCNAGFSLAGQNLMSDGMRFNYFFAMDHHGTCCLWGFGIYHCPKLYFLPQEVGP